MTQKNKTEKEIKTDNLIVTGCITDLHLTCTSVYLIYCLLTQKQKGRIQNWCERSPGLPAVTD